MGRLAKAPMMKQAMQEEAAVAVMRDFLVVACRQQGGPHSVGPLLPRGSADQGSGWTGCQQVPSCEPREPHSCWGADPKTQQCCRPSSCAGCFAPEQDHHAAAAALRRAGSRRMQAGTLLPA